MKSFKEGDRVVLISKECTWKRGVIYNAPVNVVMEVMPIGLRDTPANCHFINEVGSIVAGATMDLVFEGDLVSEELFNSPLFQALG